MSTKVDRTFFTQNLDKCEEFVSFTIIEYRNARQKFGPFDNGHEGLAVIWEEFEELKSFVFGKNQTQEEVENAKKECIQLAAMALAFCVELL